MTVNLPLDVPATYRLHRMGKFDPTTRVEPGRWLRTFCTSDGPATLELEVAEGRHVSARVWGSGSTAIRPHLAELVGSADDLSGFEPGAALATVARRLKGLRIIKLPCVLRGIVQIILEQRITWREAVRSFQALVTRYGEPAPGPFPLMVFPKASVLRGLSFAQWAELGVEQRRAETIRRVAVSHRRVEELRSMSVPEAEARLRAFQGVGPWTCQATLGYVLGHRDAVLVGDFGLPSAVAWNLAREPKADDARMLELLEPYRGHRWRVIRMIQELGVHAPRRGPRRKLGPLPGRGRR